LQWKDDHPPMKSNYQLSKAFLMNVKKKLTPEMLKIYDDIIQNGIARGVFEETTHSPASGHYLPHFFILQPNRTTTPIRQVFAANLGHPSLNECLHTGPSMIADLPTLLQPFRCHVIGVTHNHQLTTTKGNPTWRTPARLYPQPF
jgi:hypothetical protein